MWTLTQSGRRYRAFEQFIAIQIRVTKCNYKLPSKDGSSTTPSCSSRGRKLLAGLSSTKLPLHRPERTALLVQVCTERAEQGCSGSPQAHPPIDWVRPTALGNPQQARSGTPPPTLHSRCGVVQISCFCHSPAGVGNLIVEGKERNRVVPAARKPTLQLTGSVRRRWETPNRPVPGPPHPPSTPAVA